MLTQLDAYSPNVSVAPFDFDLLGTVETDPFQITNIEGLGPVAAEVSTSKFGSLDGEVYIGSNVGKRNVVITVRLNPDWANGSVEALRQMLNAQFATGAPIRLVFTTTELDQRVQLHGYVESFAPNIFSADPEYQISVICPDPYFVDLAPQTMNGQTSYAESSTSASFGTVETLYFPGTNIVNFDYLGTAPTGFELYLPPHTPGGAANRLVVFNKHSAKIETWSCVPVLVDDTHSFKISTVPGNKFAQIIYGPSMPPANALSRVPTSSIWPQFKHGRNNFQVSHGTTQVPWELTYYRRWVGL